MKNTVHRFSDKEELDALDHALRFVLSGSHDDDTEPSLRLLDARIDAAQSRARRSRLRRWLYPAAAAAIAIVSTVGLTMFFTHGSNVQRYANNGEAAIMVGLPDGTQAWLNPGTELVFDSSFNTDERNVSLSGEAYFDVAHNPECPFIVTTESFRIKVLGTVFNVRNFPGDTSPEVSLAQGSVAMQNLDGINLVRLRPGQQAVFDVDDCALEINDIYVGDMLMRHYGAVSLKGATIKEIVSEISEMYGVGISIGGEDDGTTYNFSFQKDSNVGDILDMLEFVCEGVEFSIE